MLKNHLKIALRQMGRNKVLSTINIFGLSLGMAVAVLIAVYIRHEFSYDRWMEGNEHTYRVYRLWGGVDKTAWTPSLLAKKLETDFPEVEVATGFSPGEEMLIEYAGNKLYVEENAAVDSTFFQVLPLPFLYGNVETALNEPKSMVISDKLAEKVFGKANPIGEIVRYGGDEGFIIKGVFSLGDNNFHLKADIFTRLTWYSNYWTGNNRATYVKLKPIASKENLELKLTESITKLMEKEYLANNYTPTAKDFAEWKLQPLNEIHLHAGDVYFYGTTTGNIQNIYIFLIIGFLVLLVAIVNYVNLATARASQRAKEVGVRKVIGAERSQLTLQFITESIMQALFSAAIALIVAELLLPFFNTITDRELTILGGQSFWVITSITGLAIITGLLAGIYPAFVLSAFRPVRALKSNFLKTGDKGLFRKVLVTGQFAITITLLIVLGFIYRQVNFMMQHELGFHPDQVMVIPMNSNKTYRKIGNIKARFESIPGVQNLTTATRFPGQLMPDWGMLIEGRLDAVSPFVIFSDADYAKTLNIEMTKGRFISPDIAADTVNNYFVNETFVKRYNIENPIGTRIKFTSDTTYGQIVGVMKDFHVAGLGSNIRPLVMNGRHQRWSVGIKLSTDNIAATIVAIKNIWSEVEPSHPMRYSFLDEDFAAQYGEQQRFGKTMLYAALLTLFIAILGLFGLTAFNVERRTREIGIRKVLGATVVGIVSLLSKDFLKLGGIAFLIAIPIGYYIANLWLEDFAYRSNLAWWVFALAGFTMLFVGFLTVSFQSVKAALANPVESLKTE